MTPPEANDPDFLRIETELLRERNFRQMIVESLPGIFYVFDASGCMRSWNKNLETVSGFNADEISHLHPLDLIDGADKPQIAEAIKHAFTSGHVKVEARLLTKDGLRIPYIFSGTRAEFDGNPVLVGLGIDITEHKETQDRVVELAFFDHLTGLPNRTLLLDRLRQAMTAGLRSGSFGALLFIDLDNFKTLNDTLGHDMGDLLLKQVAERLTACVRAGDSVARLGGDEFLLMLPSLSFAEADAAAKAESVGDKILAALNRPYLLGAVSYHNTPSIGATLFRGSQASTDDLLKQIDIAMYKAKSSGRNTICFFDPAMESALMARATLEADLRDAIQQEQFRLYYQPQIVGEGRLVGAEALLRWQHPLRGMVSPAEFIPMLEDTGLILSVGEWVLETACAQLAMWASRPDTAGITVAVNVSAHQFRQADFVDMVLAVLARTGADPQRLKLELTESMLVENIQEIIAKMFTLKAKGVCFSLDDFGTGYSSLSYLKRLPLDQLKIDQSFVHDVLIDPNDAAIAKTIVMLAQSLGMAVIAEGVETEAQRDFLASAGCHAYQGYFYSRPLPLDRFEQFCAASMR